MTDFSLACGRCGRTGPALPAATVCEACAGPLLVQYAPSDGPAPAWSGRPGSMWRYREFLPLRKEEAPLTLGEGATPLLELPSTPEVGGVRLLVKDESRNPTGSFKDRGLATAVTRAVLDGIESFVIPSAGNAGAALAAYCARAAVPARVFVPSDTPNGVIRRCERYGAEVTRVDGLIAECGRRAAEHAAGTGAFDVSTLREPYRIEGKKTMMLEIVEELGGRAPDAIVYPTGGGTGLIGSWKALQELRAHDAVVGSTRLYCVQATGCAPIVQAWERGDERATTWERPRTAAWGLRVPGALGDFLILRALRESGGGAIAVSDAEMRTGAEALGRRGISASIEGGATLAGARVLCRRGAFRAGETVVLFNTAGALVY